MAEDSRVNRSREIGAPGPTGGGSSQRVGCGNAEKAACRALIIVDATAIPSNVVKILLPPGAEGAARPGNCIKGAAPGRISTVKSACIKENGVAAGERYSGSPAHLAKADGVASDGDELAPRAIVEGAGTARGMRHALRDAMGEFPRIVLLECGV